MQMLLMMFKMFRNIVLVWCYLYIIIIPGIACSQPVENSGKRFLGFHFDFHAKKEDKDIGKNLDQAAIEEFLRVVNPDFVQVDTKGLFGISSYPTKVGFTSYDYPTDILKVWRELTSKHGIALYSHYTTLMDEEAANRFPSWARIKGDNQKDNTKVSIFSSYSKDLFLPQVKEFITEYDLDGIWVDADSWAFEPEYGSKVKSEFKSKTSINDIPSAESENYKKYIEFLRNEYVNYAENYVDQIHSMDPDFKVGINWAYSKMMPEPVEIDIDYLSADMSGKNWIYDAAFDARVFASYDKPWDLMSWSFYDKGTKPEKLLLLEASEVISMGGGYQSYWFQKRNGGFDKNNLALMKKIADFCRAREPYCFESKTIPQVGVFFSRETWAKNTGSIYNGGGNDNIQGITSLLLDAGSCVQIIMENDLNSLSTYPFVVIPESHTMSPSVKNKFISYVNNGGRLLVMGSKASQLFEKELNVSFMEQFVYKEYTLKSQNSTGTFDLPYAQVKANNTNDILMNTYTAENTGKIFSPFVTSRNMGKGMISGLYSDLGDYYYKNTSDFLVGVIKEIMNDIFSLQLVTMVSNEKVHINFSEKNGKKYVHLINVNHIKPFMTADYYGQFNPVRNVHLNIKLPSKPQSILLQPDNKEISFTYSGGAAEINIDNLDVYSILEIVN
jgi:hypothetical protein